MKRTVEFKPIENGYACFEGEDCVFKISSDDLQFNVKEFYQAFYADGNDYFQMNIINVCDESDSNGRRIFECIHNLTDRIKEKYEDSLMSDNITVDDGKELDN